MDFECIEAWLELPEFRVTDQVIRSHELELHLERRDTSLVCPRCQGCCERIKDGRARCVRDLPLLDRPVTLRLDVRRFRCSDCHHRPWEKSETFGDHVKWTERLYTSKVTGEGLLDCKIAREYLRISLQGVQNVVKTRVWEIAPTPLLGVCYAFCTLLPCFRLEWAMSNLAFIFK